MATDDEILCKEFRSHFPIFRNKVYLNSCSQGALSDAVDAALNEFMSGWHTHGSPWDRWIGVQEELRGEFASMIGAGPDEVAVTFSASSAISAVASALDFRVRPDVLMGELEFPTMAHIWLAQAVRGACVSWVPASGETNTPADYRLRADDRTGIVPVTHVCFRNGFRNDAAGIARAAHDAGAYCMIDDYQSCGTRPVDIQALGADFYVTGALKYLLGTAGIAFLYIRRDLAEKLQPASTGWFAQQDPFAFDNLHHRPARTAARFQSGTPAIAAAYASLAALRLLRDLGPARVERQIAGLTRRFIDGAAASGRQLKTPPDSSGPLVVLRMGDAAGSVAELEKHGIIVSSRGDGLRFSFHAYNTPGDVDVALEALGRLH